jgi:hypothetical protein
MRRPQSRGTENCMLSFPAAAAAAVATVTNFWIELQVRERLLRDHQIAKFVDRFQQQSSRLLDIQADADGFVISPAERKRAC